VAGIEEHGCGGHHGSGDDDEERHDETGAEASEQSRQQAREHHREREAAVCPGDDRHAGRRLRRAGSRVHCDVGRARGGPDEEQAERQADRVVGAESRHDTGETQREHQDGAGPGPPAVDRPPDEQHGRQGACADEQQRGPEPAVGHLRLLLEPRQRRTPGAPERPEGQERDVCRARPGTARRQGSPSHPCNDTHPCL